MITRFGYIQPTQLRNYASEAISTLLVATCLFLSSMRVCKWRCILKTCSLDRAASPKLIFMTPTSFCTINLNTHLVLNEATRKRAPRAVSPRTISESLLRSQIVCSIDVRLSRLHVALLSAWVSDNRWLRHSLHERDKQQNLLEHLKLEVALGRPNVYV